MKKLNQEKFVNSSVNWLKERAKSANKDGFVIGISGGVDSAVVSTLCAMTGMKLLCLEMPIRQGKSQVARAKNHIDWLKKKFANVSSAEVDLTSSYESLHEKFGDYRDGIIEGEVIDESNFEFVMGNTRSRMRMITLYQFSGMYNLLVAGTGNKVEDFGIGFFTKGGDQIVDISPIADINKTEVWNLARHLGVNSEIIEAKPTDGLHEDGRTDEDQIGASYDELEWAMETLKYIIDMNALPKEQIENVAQDLGSTDREKEVLRIYIQRHRANQHKMNPIPVFDASGCRK